MVEQTKAIFHLQIVGAKGLSTQEKSQKPPNLYVKVQIGDFTKSTKLVKQTTNPSWNDEFKFTALASSMLRFRVKHELWLRRQELGTVEMEVSKLLVLGKDRQDVILKLEDARHSNKNLLPGEMIVRFWTEDTASAGSVATAAARQAVTDRLESGKSATKSLETVVSKLKLLVDIVNEAAQIHPYVNLVWKVTSTIYQIMKDQLDRDQSLVDLMDSMERVYSFVDEIQSVPDKINTLEKTIESILQQTFECAMFIQEYAGCGFTKKALSEVFTQRATDQIAKFTQKFIEMKSTLDTGIAIHIAVASSRTLGKVDILVRQQTLSQLRPANMNQYGRQRCLPGTRVDVLDFISAWVAHPSKDQNILWLHGPAGSGKSTLSTTVANLFQQTNRLGAFLFFNRNVSEQNKPGLVVQTLAYRLALSDHRIGDVVSGVIQKNLTIADDNIDLQFKKLLLEPLDSLADLQSEGPIVVVLDALDECGNAEERKPLLKILAEASAHLPSFLRVIITSRPYHDIKCQFESKSHVLLYGLNVTPEFNQKDIDSFFRYRMAEIRIENPNMPLTIDWPGEQRIQALVERASGLFIWASTACNYIDAYDPEDRLVTLLQADMGSDARSALDTLYMTALQSTGRCTDLAFGADFRVIVGTLLVARNPLSITALSKLLMLENHQPPPDHIISQLGCVLNSNGIIRILHPSFADFLSDPDRCKSDVWFIDTKLHNIRVACNCLDDLSVFWRENVHNVTFSKGAQASLPEHIAYACGFWVEHVCMITDASSIADRLHTFLFGHLLHWFEAMSILKQSEDTKEMMRCLCDWHKTALPGNPLLQELISDAYQFSRAFSGIIRKDPLQVYAGALPFTPVGTLLYRTFHDESQHPWIVALKSCGKSWSPPLATFHEIRPCYCIRFSPDSTQVMGSGRFGVFLIPDIMKATADPLIRRGLTSRSCAFSPDGTWACSIHDNGYMRMWDPMLEYSIMEPIPIPHSGRQEATFLVTSPHGAFIAYSCNHTIYVWARSGMKIFESTPQNTQTNITCLTFSPDSNLIVSGSENGDISFWDLSSGGEVLGQVRDHAAWVLSVHAMVDGSQKILSVGKDWFVRVWNATLGTCILARSLQTHDGVARLAAFSADGQQIVLCTSNGTIGLWSSSSGMQIHIITTNLPFIVDVALSPNGKIIASANSEQAVSLWDATIPADTTVNLSHRQWPTPCITDAPCIKYSSDGTLLAIAATEDEQPNPIILILDGNSGKEKYEPLQGHKGKDIESIVFSPDTLLIASSSNDGICVWDATKGTQVTAITEAQESSILALAFSPDGRHLVSGSRHGGVIYVWDADSGTTILGPLHGCPTDSESIDSVSFSPDGGQIVSASGNGIVHIWDAESGAMILGPFHGCPSYSLLWPRVAFSMDGTRIIVHTRHGNLKQWDAITGAEIINHDQPVNILTCGAVDRFSFCRPSGWIIDLTTGFHLSYPTVPLIFGMRSTSSQTSVAFATHTNIYIIHFPPRMLCQ